MFQTFLTRKTLKGKFGTERALKVHFKGTGALKTLKALGQSSTWGTQAPEGHLDSLALRHLGTQELGHSKGIWSHLIQTLKALYLVDFISTYLNLTSRC